MKRRNSYVSTLAMLLLLLSLVAAACAPAPTAEPEATAVEEQEEQPTEPQEESEPAEEDEPAEEGEVTTLFVGWDLQSDNLDPQTSRGNRNWHQLGELYEGLTVLKDQDLTASPHLAESWEVSEDGTEYTFYLRKGVKFHTGREMTAEDVKFCMDRLTTIGKGPLYMIRGVYDRVELVDDYTVTFYLNHAYNVFPEILSQPSLLGVADKEAILEHCGEPEEGQLCDWLSNNSAGTGAYMLEEFEPNARTVLVKHPDYWQGWEGEHVDRVVWESIMEESTRLLRLEKGDLDIAAVSAAQLPALEERIDEQDLRIKITKTNDEGEPLMGLGKTWVHLNNQLLPTSDYNVRRALIHSFNYDQYIDRVLRGYAVRLKGMIPDGVPCHVDDYPSYEYDLDLAAEFLEKASPEAKEAMEGLELVYRADYVLGTEGALMWQADLAKIGVDLQLREVDDATISDLKTSAPGVPMIPSRWAADFPDPDNFVNIADPGYWPPQGYGAAFFGNDYTRELILEAKQEPDQDKRCEMYRELELYTHEQAAVLPLAQTSGVLNHWNAQRENVHGFEYNAMIHPIYYNMWKED